MLGVDARSVAVGWFVVVISIGTLEAGQRSPARPRQRLIGGWGCYPSSQQRSWSSMPRRRQEEEPSTQYVAAGRVDTNRGLNYLALLKKRH